MTSLSQPIVIPLVQIRLLFSRHLETWGKLGVGSHRIISWDFYQSFHATFFKVQTQKSNQCLLLKAKPSLKNKGSVLLVKLFFQTKFTSRSYSGLISGGGEVHKGGCYMNLREGFQLQADLDKNALGDSVHGHQKFGEKTGWGSQFILFFTLLLEIPGSNNRFLNHQQLQIFRSWSTKLVSITIELGTIPWSATASSKWKVKVSADPQGEP